MVLSIVLSVVGVLAFWGTTIWLIVVLFRKEDVRPPIGGVLTAFLIGSVGGVLFWASLIANIGSIFGTADANERILSIEPAAALQRTPTPEPELSDLEAAKALELPTDDREAITLLMQTYFRGEASPGRPRLKYLGFEDTSSGLRVDLTFFAENDGSVSRLLGRIYTEMREAYQLIFETDIDVINISVAADTTINNRFGNEVEITPGFSTKMFKGVGENINWDEANDLDFTDLWSNPVLDRRLR